MRWLLLTVTFHQFLCYCHHADPGRAGPIAATASNAAELSPTLDICGQLVMDTPPGAQCFGPQRVMTAGFAHESVELARIPDPAALGALAMSAVLNAETAAGRTNQVAAAAEDAAIGNFRPEFIRDFVFHKQATGLMQEVKMCRNAVVEVA